MKIAVTGATGFIGRGLIRALSQTKHDIIGLSRRAAIPDDPSSRLKFLSADIHNAESLKKALLDVQIVYHLVGIISETKKLTFAKTVVGGTDNLINACHEAGVGKIIYLSALGTGPESSTKYFQSKWRAEKLIRKSGLEYVIMRPSVVFGPEDKFINMLAKMIKYSPFTPIPGNGRMRLQPIYVKDLSAILTAILEKSEIWGKTVETGGPEALEYREIIAIIKKVLNRRRPNIYIPLWLMKLNAAVLEAVLKPSPLTRDQIKMLGSDNICDNRELLNVIDIKLTRLEDGLKEYLR